MAKPLTVIFNQSLQTGIVPSVWKFSNVTPIYKRGDKSDLGNFRPISVVPVVAKLLEKLIANQLRSYLESCHLLHDHQGRIVVAGHPTRYYCLLLTKLLML